MIQDRLLLSSARASLAGAALLLTSCFWGGASSPASAMGVIRASTAHLMPRHIHCVPSRANYSQPTGRQATRRPLITPSTRSKTGGQLSARNRSGKLSRYLARAPKAKGRLPVVAAQALKPQDYISQLANEQLAPGVVHRYFRGPLNINVVDVDMVQAPVKVQPYLANSSFCGLKDVSQHARESNAIAAVNANYFKPNGTPLGTLIVNGEWVAGPLYDRVSMGISQSGNVRIDRVSLGGSMTSSNAEVPNIWVNNINQPRRTGCHLIAYTRRWGSFVRLPYAGCLVAIDGQGVVLDQSTTVMGVPWGGYVLSDSKGAPISHLKRGDRVQITWHTNPSSWDDVTQAVSGGPMLIKDGNLYVDVNAENFRKGWTSSHITARTAAGVTRNNHLLLATIEGPHTMWDLAKFLHSLGAVDAMNLDGGGSTTMVVNGNTVTRNAHATQRHVATSLVVLDMRKAPYLSRATTSNYNYSQGSKTHSGQEVREAAGSAVPNTTTTASADTHAASPSPLATPASPQTIVLPASLLQAQPQTPAASQATTQASMAPSETVSAPQPPSTAVLVAPAATGETVDVRGITAPPSESVDVLVQAKKPKRGWLLHQP